MLRKVLGKSNDAQEGYGQPTLIHANQDISMTIHKKQHETELILGVYLYPTPAQVTSYRCQQHYKQSKGE